MQELLQGLNDKINEKVMKRSQDLVEWVWAVGG